jgi:hypothetical protein
VILFPFAAIWLVAIVVWAIRKGLFEAPPPPGQQRRRPRPPRSPRPHGRRDGGAAARSTPSRRERERSAG